MRDLHVLIDYLEEAANRDDGRLYIDNSIWNSHWNSSMGEVWNSRWRKDLKLHAIELLTDFGFMHYLGEYKKQDIWTITHAGYDFLNHIYCDEDLVMRIEAHHSRGVSLKKSIENSL